MLLLVMHLLVVVLLLVVVVGVRERTSAARELSAAARAVRRRGVLTSAAALLVSAFVLLVGALTTAPDGRSVTRSWAEGGSTSSPYPGWAYGLPVGTALLALALATWWALRTVDARPALDPVAHDQAVCLGSRIRVLRFAAAGALAAAAGLCFQMGATLNSVTQAFRGATVDAPPVEWAPVAPLDWVQNGGFALIILGLAAFTGVVLALTWDAPPLPTSRDQRSRATSGTQSTATS